MPGDPLAYGLFAIYGLAAVLIVAGRFRVALPAVISYVIMLSVALFRYSQYGLSAPDAFYYDRMAVAIANGESSDAISAGKEGLSQTLAVFYSLFGHDPVYGLWLNAIACALSVGMVGGVAHRLGLPVKTAAWLASVYPAVIIWGTLLLREPMVWLLICVLIFAVSGIAAATGRMAVNVGLLIVAFVGLLAFRGSVGIAVTISAIAAIFVSRPRGRYQQWGIYLLLAAVFALMYFTPLAEQIEGVLGRYSFERVEVSREALQRTADSGFAISSGNPVASALTALPRVLAGPFVWEFTTVGFEGVAEGLLWLCLLLLAIRGWLQLPSRRVANVVVIPALTLLLVLAMTSGNYGTMVRLRTQVAVLLFPLAAAGISRIFSKSGARQEAAIRVSSARR